MPCPHRASAPGSIEVLTLGQSVASIHDGRRVHEKRNSFRTGEPENSGFSKMQLVCHVSVMVGTVERNRLTLENTADRRASFQEIWA